MMTWAQGMALTRTVPVPLASSSPPLLPEGLSAGAASGGAAATSAASGGAAATGAASGGVAATSVASGATAAALPPPPLPSARATTAPTAATAPRMAGTTQRGRPLRTPVLLVGGTACQPAPG